ncbi:hypothetical protein [Pseudomonas chlororaphis]|uniref:hypothetical protein n=1 Tax=Pseudomonas chlororaphis TaxID=587753 RepID=UPI0024089107|nr:hypothetical protein [Pseudomonas chlororaphis]
MAQINITLKTTRRWWMVPLLNCAASWCWITGRGDVPAGFIDWVVRHGLKIEVE